MILNLKGEKVNKLCFGNWKLNKSPKEAQVFLNEFLNLVKQEEKNSFAVFPQALTAGVFSSENTIPWGGQNIYFHDAGAFTGENSVDVLNEMGASYVLVGHSERRSLFHESNSDVCSKVKLILEKGLTPVVCIGESLDERESGKVFDVLSKQIEESLDGVNVESIVLAYEPVWAIGTGKTATPVEVKEVHSWLREKLETEKTALLYGGSVKPENSEELFKIKDVNGFLIGGASLKAESFYQIYQNMTS